MTKRTQKASTEKEGANAISLMLQIVTLLAGVIGLMAAISAGRPASAIALLVIVIAAIGFALIYIWRARLKSGAHRYGWQRWIVLAISTSIIVFLGIVNIIPHTRGIFIYNILGFHQADVPMSLRSPREADTIAFKFRCRVIRTMKTSWTQ
ncbi:MAG TPA: hypothetical protein VFW50_16735 [Streptosporangiaceae bacterium]|nr:hypothetical protein [Streptosporangiaceae bacterium]